jgi:uncharacterized protein YoxC
MDSIFSLIAIIIMALTFIALPVYLLFLTLSSKKVDQQIKNETTNANRTSGR